MCNAADSSPSPIAFRKAIKSSSRSSQNAASRRSDASNSSDTQSIAIDISLRLQTLRYEKQSEYERFPHNFFIFTLIFIRSAVIGNICEFSSQLWRSDNIDVKVYNRPKSAKQSERIYSKHHVLDGFHQHTTMRQFKIERECISKLKGTSCKPVFGCICKIYE